MTNASILVAYDNFRTLWQFSYLVIDKKFYETGPRSKAIQTESHQALDIHKIILVSWAFDLNYRSRGLSVSWDIGLLAQSAHI